MLFFNLQCRKPTTATPSSTARHTAPTRNAHRAHGTHTHGSHKQPSDTHSTGLWDTNDGAYTRVRLTPQPKPPPLAGTDGRALGRHRAGARRGGREGMDTVCTEMALMPPPAAPARPSARPRGICSDAATGSPQRRAPNMLGLATTMGRVFGSAQPTLAPLRAGWRGVEVFFSVAFGHTPASRHLSASGTSDAPVQGRPAPRAGAATPGGYAAAGALHSAHRRVPACVFFIHLQPRKGWGMNSEGGIPEPGARRARPSREEHDAPQGEAPHAPSPCIIAGIPVG